MCGNGAIDDAQHLTHDRRLAGKQKSEWERHTEHPLTHRLMRQDFVHQQGGAFHHPPRPTAGANATMLATEGHEVFAMAGVTANPQETMFQTAAF
jgi:hypothetical protein